MSDMNDLRMIVRFNCMQQWVVDILASKSKHPTSYPTYFRTPYLILRIYAKLTIGNFPDNPTTLIQFYPGRLLLFHNGRNERKF